MQTYLKQYLAMNYLQYFFILLDMSQKFHTPRFPINQCNRYNDDLIIKMRPKKC